MKKMIPTSQHWNRVRVLINHIRIDAHAAVASKLIAQEILELQEALGASALEDMIVHEKRMAKLNTTQRFWMEKDAQDEADYERAMAKPINESEASNGI